MDNLGLLPILEGLAPPGAAVALWTGGEQVPDLFPGESQAVQNSVKKRRVEFARGRACARFALGKLGASPRPILVGPDREPVWPPGFLGSITHCEGLVAAIASRTEGARSLGLDAEPLEPLPPEVLPLIARPRERKTALSAPMRGADPGKVLFSVKESIYKAAFPLTRSYLDFLDVELTLRPEEGRFTASAVGPPLSDLPDMATLRGRFAVTSEFVVSISSFHNPIRPEPLGPLRDDPQ